MRILQVHYPPDTGLHNPDCSIISAYMLDVDVENAPVQKCDKPGLDAPGGVADGGMRGPLRELNQHRHSPVAGTCSYFF